MPLRSIPPITSTGMSRRKATKSPTKVSIGLGRVSPSQAFQETTPVSRPKRHQKPRRWVYATKPIFKMVREPIVDVFNEAEEVYVIVDLGGFARGGFNFEKEADKFIVEGKHGDQEFREEIPLPKGVDVDNIEEQFKNGILELILPKKSKRKGSKKR